MDNKITYNTRSNPSYLNKKRNMFSYYNTPLFKPLISTEFKTEYENILWLYRNVFGFSWSDRFLKDNQNVLANITPNALWFMYTGMFFPNDFTMLEHIDGHSLKEMLLAITGEQDNVNIRKGSNYKMKWNLIEDLKNISQCISNTNINAYHSNAASTLHTLCEYIEKKVSRIESINNDKLNAMAHIANKNIASINKHTLNNNNTPVNDNTDGKQQLQLSPLIAPSPLLKDTYPNPHTLQTLNAYSSYLSSLSQHTSSPSSLPLLSISSQLTQITDDDDNFVCFICNNGDIDDTTQLIYECECCSITVHQSCYGINTDTSEHWLCDPCKCFRNKHITTTLDCILCPVKGGAMKQADLPLDSQFVMTLKQIRNKEQFIFPKYNPHIIIPVNTYDTIDKVWVHLSCALWNQNVSFENFEEKKGIKYIDMMDYGLFYEMCCVCCKKGYGPVVKCNYEGCEFKAHPECARINKYGMEVVNDEGTLNYNVYCCNHVPVKYVKRINRRNKQREREVVEFAAFLKKVYKGYEKEYHKSITEMKSIVKMGNGVSVSGNNVHNNINSNNNGKSSNTKQ